MRVKDELKKLWENKVNSILDGHLDEFPPIREIFLEISQNSDVVVLLLKYSDFRVRRTNQILFIVKEIDGCWVKSAYIDIDNIIVLSMSMNDIGNEIALSVLNEGLVFCFYNESIKKWGYDPNYLKPLHSEKEDLFGHEVIYDTNGNLLVSAPFKKQDGKKTGVVYVLNPDKILDCVIDIHNDGTKHDNSFFGLSMERDCSSENRFYSNNRIGVIIRSIINKD